MNKAFLIEKLSGLVGLVAVGAVIAFSGVSTSHSAAELHGDVCLAKAKRPSLTSHVGSRDRAPIEAGLVSRGLAYSCE